MKRLILPIAAAFALFSSASASAQEGRVLEPLAAAVNVRGYPIGDGPLATFRERQEAVFNRVVADVVAERGEPLAREEPGRHGALYMVYPDALVVVSRYHSGRVCRVDMAPARLREAVRVELALSLAAQSCRSAEERAWTQAGTGLEPIRPIGAEPVAGVPGATMRFYATDQYFGLFHRLVDGVEAERRTESLLVRDAAHDEPFARDGEPQWRYAWFADGTFLAAHYVDGQRDYDGNRALGFACAVSGPAARMPRLDSGAFATWCDRHSARLRPGLANFVQAVRAWQNEQWARQERERVARGGPLPVPSMYGGFHTGEMPRDLTDLFWRTGEVPPAPPLRR